MAHTPGPWGISGLDPRHVDTRGGQMCIDCTKSGPSKAVDAANARLVAAAPELLSALRAMLADGGVLSDPISRKQAQEKARAAITKAEGRS